MTAPPRVNVGIVGAGFIAETRAGVYARLSGCRAQIVGVAGRFRERAGDCASVALSTSSSVAVASGPPVCIMDPLPQRHTFC